VADVLKALRDLLEYNDAVYQTEYDGRMLTCCIGCDVDLAVKGHENDCPVVRAQAALASIGGAAATPAVPDHIARDVEQCESADRWNDGVPFKSRWERKLYEGGFAAGWNRARAVEAERNAAKESLRV
jgi:hypothetical protein